MDPIFNHPKYLRAKERLISLGLKWEWMTDIVDPSKPGAYFLKNGQRGYRSACPYYEGFWLCGGFGSPKCSLSEELRPHIYFDMFCVEHFEECPHWRSTDEDGALDYAEALPETEERT